MAGWKRAGAITGLIAAVLLAATLILLSLLPAIGSTGQLLVVHLRARYAVTVAASYAGALTAVMLIPFVASLKAFTRDLGGEAEWRWTVTLLSAAAAVSLIVAGCASLAASALLADQTADGPAVGALFAGGKACLTFALTPLGLVVLANARTLSSSKTPARWLIRIDLEIGVLAVVSGAALFIHGSWFGAGEPVIAAVGVLIALWVTTIALVMLEGGDAGIPDSSE
jgi:hypothetical protein